MNSRGICQYCKIFASDWLYKLFIPFFILAVRFRGVGTLFNINPLGRKGGETLGDLASVFQNLKSGAAPGAGLIPWID